MLSEARAKTNAAHQSKLERIVMQPYKAEGARIKYAAAAAGTSVTKYILEAVRARMDAEGVPEVIETADVSEEQ